MTIEPNTEFFSRPPALPIDDRLADIQNAGMIMLQENQFEQYEVSAFSLKGKKAAHNMNYWQFGDYLGVGAGAHGKISLPDEEQVLRTTKTRQPDHYLDRIGSALSQSNPIKPDEMTLEFMMNGLRLKQGVSIDYFMARTGIDPKSIRKATSHLESMGLLEPNSDHYRTTPLGYQFLNTVLQSF